MNAFDVQATTQQMAQGSGTLTGTAFLRQNGGGIVTCAGNEVMLQPATAYTDEVTRISVGGTTRIGATLYDGGRYTRVPDNLDERFVTLSRMTVCDAEGNFTFDNVKDGEYVVVTDVKWFVARQRQGGTLATRAIVKDGKSSRLVLSK
ncbi:hypothetical protein IMZ29_08285 [Achromobacter sp. GG226]|uniref:hypothetical protein n=1 Tax=Verticiella alkaliphila TaxID=2779529 RepID=UPI001C0C24FF|nr:hypothetical protein [Verticiella sp. GG226]MBU4610536.1 hypothetical protein [Verticiella sp. GG226]